MSQHLGLTNSELLHAFEEFELPSQTRTARKKRIDYRRGQIGMAGVQVPVQAGPQASPSADDLEMEIRDSRTSRYVVSVGGRRHSSITEVDSRDLGTERTSGKWFGEADDEKDMDVESIVAVPRPKESEMQGSLPSPSTHAWAMRMHAYHIVLIPHFSLFM